MKKLLALAVLVLAPFAAADTIHVSAAISLKESLDAAAKAFEAKTGTHVDLALGASGTLETQIINGAPCDLFIAAADKQVDDLIAKKLADAATRRQIATNTMVLIVPAGKTEPKAFADLGGDAVKKIAAGEPRTVPAGDYAKQIFESLKLTDAVKPKLVYGTNVRQVLDYVKRGDVDAGLVYGSDAMSASKDVTVVATADAKWCKPINYPSVIPSAATHADEAKAFADFLLSDAGQAELVKHGFASPAK
jgi:molybdate transport system substrate-binding protein